MTKIGASALVTICLLALPGGVRAQGARTSEPPSIRVTGVGEVKVKPDIARLEIGVQTLDKDAARAVRRNAAHADAVIRAIRSLGVRDSDIQTSGLELSAEYTEEKDPKFKGYKVSNTVTITLRKIGDVGKTLDAAVRAGANVATNVTFDINDADKEKAQEEATLQAVADAKREAILLAKASGIKDIELYALNKDGAYQFDFTKNRTNLAGGNIQGGISATYPVAPGRISIGANVTAIYRFASGNLVAIP